MFSIRLRNNTHRGCLILVIINWQRGSTRRTHIYFIFFDRVTIKVFEEEEDEVGEEKKKRISWMMMMRDQTEISIQSSSTGVLPT